MASHIITRRIQYIIQFVYDTKYPSKRAIIDFLEEKDFDLTPRTLERDFERIRTDLGLEITYSKKDSGYFIDEENSVHVESFFKLLEIVSIADIFSESLKESKKLLDYVSFDDSKSFKGIEYLRTILLAISQNRTLLFKHFNYEKETLKPYKITPLLLKEFENRWYVIGVPEGKKEIRIFGIDRIYDVSLGKSTILKKATFKNQLKNYDNVIGLHIHNKNPVKVRLYINEIHVKYMQSLPLHHSQVIHPKDEKGFHFVDFYLIPNYEFKTLILKMGDYAEVVEPISLRNDVKNMLKSTLKRYQ